MDTVSELSFTLQEGTLVQSPTFYLSFVCTEEPLLGPSSDEKNHVLFLTQEDAIAHLKTKYPGNFLDVSLKVNKVEIGQHAAKPIAGFNLCVEFDAAASFWKDPPTPNELFNALASGLVSSKSIQNVQSIGGTFSKVSMMAINCCKMQDGKYLMPAEAERGPYKKAQEPVKLSPKDNPSNNDNGSYHRQARVVLILQILGHFEPREADYEALASVTQEFYAKTMQKEYGDLFQDVHVSVGKASFGPVQRDESEYNFCVQWDVSTTFDPNGSSSGKKKIPDQCEIVTCLVTGNNDKYFKHIRNLSGTSFAGTKGFFTE